MNLNESDIFSNIREKIKNQSLTESDLKFLWESNKNLKEYIIKTAENLHRPSLNYPELVSKIIKKENFSFMRIQDGEWTCIFKIEPHYTNKMATREKSKKFIDELSIKIFDIIKKKPKYHIFVNAGTFDERVNLVWPYLKPLENLGVGEIFRRVSVETGLYDFVEALKSRDVILVGPNWLNKLEDFNFTHIITPFPDLYRVENEIRITEEVDYSISTLINKNPVILYSCGLLAKVLIDRFYTKFTTQITQIDMGAIWDPYCGKITRPYHKKVTQRIKGLK